MSKKKRRDCSCNGAQQRDCPYIEVRSTISPLLAPSFFLSRPLRQVAATNDNLLVVHLPEDLLTLISGHRRGGRQLNTIELRPPIPLLHSSLLIFPLPLPRSAPLRPAQRTPVLFEFSSATTVTSLWRSVLPKLQANYGSVARGIEIFEASRSQTRIADTVVVRERKNLTPSRPTNQQGRQVTRTLSLGPRQCGCSLHLNHVQFRFPKHT